jgi:hypothetical protein
MLLFCCSFILSCSTTKKQEKNYFDFVEQEKKIQIVEFEEVDAIEIPFDSLMKVEAFSINDSVFIYAGYQRKTNRVFIYEINLNQKTIKRDSLYFNFDLPYPYDFGFMNRDSIFLVYPPACREFYHDSILILTNMKGEILKSVSFENAPVLCRKNPEYKNNDRAVYLHSNLYQDFTFTDNKVFLTFSPKTDVLGNPAYENLPLAGYIDIQTDSFTLVDFDFPDVEYGKTFFSNVNVRFLSTLVPGSRILYAFHYTPVIYNNDYKSDVLTSIRLYSAIYDTVYSSPNEKDIPAGYDFDMPYPKYFNILYDKFRNLYFRFIIAPPEYKGKISVSVYDADFNFIAEGFPPVNNFNLFFTKDYIISVGNKTKTPSKGNMFITFYKLKFREGTNQELISKIKAYKQVKKTTDKPITHYLKNNGKIKEKNYTAVIMYYEMCPNTREFVTGFFKFNKDSLSRNQVYLYIVTQNARQLREDLRKLDLMPETDANIFIDSTYTYTAYSGSKRNDLPRIVKVRNGKIENDTIINNDKNSFHTDFQLFLINSGKEQAVLNK